MHLLKLAAVVSVVGVATPALACHTGAHGHIGLGRGVGIQLGSIFFGIAKHRHVPCPQVVQAPAVLYAPPPLVYAPQPVVYAPAPRPQVVYVPAPAPLAQARVAPPPPPTRPGFLALKYMPGASTGLSSDHVGIQLTDPGFAHSAGLELRFTRWLSLRSDLEFRRDSRTWDMLGAKVSLFPNSGVKPYASVSLAATELLAAPGRYSLGVAGAGGIDIFFGKHFFIEAEVRYRVTPGACCSEVPSVTGLIGGGVAFF